MLSMLQIFPQKFLNSTGNKMTKKLAFSAFLILTVVINSLFVMKAYKKEQDVTSLYDKIDLPLQLFLRQSKKNLKDKLPCCQWDENFLAGRLAVDESNIDLEKIAKTDTFLKQVNEGGRWNPVDCRPKIKVAILIPFRNRDKHLVVLLRQLHQILQRQKLDYRIFVIEQLDDNPFNRAKLLNIGFNESQRYDDYDCFVFHDVDLIPEDDRNDYGCPSSPRHMCPAVDKFSYVLFSPYLFGGVTAFKKEDFISVNGYSNKCYGWGAEDDDMYHRLTARDMKVTRPPLETGRYKMLKHKDEERNGLVERLLDKAVKFMEKDGLRALRYGVETRMNSHLYTKIGVDLQMTDDEKRLTTVQKKKNAD